MAFKHVFYALREIFPQVDLRILKAVASQYSYDVDAAVEFVLSDVLPAVSESTDKLHDVDYAHHTNCHDGPLCGDNKMEECFHIEDKVVINETRTAKAALDGLLQDHYNQVGSSSTFATDPHMIECEQSASGACFDHCAPKKDIAVSKAKITGNHKNFSDNELPDLVATSGGSFPLYMHSPSNCVVLYEREMATELFEAKHKHCSSMSEDNCYLDTLSVNLGSSNPRQTSNKLPDAPTVLTLTKSQDNNDLELLFQKDVTPKLSKAEGIDDFSKLKDNHNLGKLFLNFCSTEDIYISKYVPSVPTIHTHSKAEDNYDFQILFEDFAIARKELGVLNTAENPSELDKSENDDNFYNLFGGPCATDSTTQVPFDIHGNNENEQPLDKLDSHHHLFDSRCEMGDQSEKEVMYNTLDEYFACPSVELDAFLPNGKKMMPSAYTSEEFLDISSRSCHTAQINKYISDFTKSKEALSSLSESTTLKMKEVELQEENSQDTKEDAAKAHQYFLAMVEHFNKLTENAKESNDKQAQVVCKEKSLLVALVQDLQYQLTKLSAQKDELLATVQEVKFELDARLATSINKEAAARNQIIQEEKLTLLTCKHKEDTMENIIEDSRKLQKEAEQNNLLRGLLLDRGHIINLLEEEISSIHANVVALKKRASASKLKSSLVTTSCTASSTHMDDCKSTAMAQKQCPEKHYSRKALSLNTVDYHENNHVASLEDEWELLDANQA